MITGSDRAGERSAWMATVADGARSGDDSGRSGPLSDDERAELAALRSRFPARHRLRSALAAVLITLAAVLAPLSAVAVWVADEMGDTGRYVRTVGPLASHPDVRAAVTDRVTDAVMSKVDLDTLLSSVAPTDRPKAECGARRAPRPDHRRHQGLRPPDGGVLRRRAALSPRCGRSSTARRTRPSPGRSPGTAARRCGSTATRSSSISRRSSRRSSSGWWTAGWASRPTSRRCTRSSRW